MFPRLAPVLAASLALLIAACGGASSAGSAPTTAPAATATPVVVTTPDPTEVPAPPTPATPVATPVIGAVDGKAGGPELTVEPIDAETFRVTLDDPVAKAWRLAVTGTGERAGDRWEITVETGDVGPLISATEVVDGKVVDTLDLSGFTDGTAAAGGCHSTLPVCLDSDGFRLPQDGDGRFSVRLQLPDPHTPLEIRGATAAWGDQPFVLGAWRETEPFPWGQG